MGVEKKDIEFVVGPEGVGLRNTPELEDTIASARLSKKRVREVLEEYFAEAVRRHLSKPEMEFETLVELHAERAIENAIISAVERGWGSSRSIEKEVQDKIRELVSVKIASGYRVEVAVRLVRI